MFYCVSLGQPLIVESVGIIEKDRFIDYRETKVISRRRQNLRGINLKASIVITNNDTLNHLNDYRCKKKHFEYVKCDQVYSYCLFSGTLKSIQ